jgi:hypothetical protein
VGKFRYVAVQPDRAALRKKIKTASFLQDVLTDCQTDARGYVNYGRPISYAWIRSRWPGNPDDRPCVRTLKYHMADLKRARLVEVRKVAFGGGMVVRMLGSAKWQEERAALAVQLPLFAPRIAPFRGVEKPVDNPVEKQCKSTVSQIHMGQDFAPLWGKTLPRKDVKNLPEETIRAVAAAHAVPSVEMTDAQLLERRELLRKQARMLEEKFKNAG